MTQQLSRIPGKHNRALQIVVENMLKQLPVKPINNLKKLLEIYTKMLAVNNSAVVHCQVRTGSFNRRIPLPGRRNMNLLLNLNGYCPAFSYLFENSERIYNNYQ